MTDTARISRIERTLDLLLQALNAGITSERFALIQAAIREWGNRRKTPENAGQPGPTPGIYKNLERVRNATDPAYAGQVTVVPNAIAERLDRCKERAEEYAAKRYPRPSWSELRRIEAAMDYERGFTDAMQQRTEVTDARVQAALASEMPCLKDERTDVCFMAPCACMQAALEAAERVRSEEGCRDRRRGISVR